MAQFLLLRDEVIKNMTKANKEEINEIYEFYKYIVEYMDTHGLKLGWDIDKYPDITFVTEMVNKGEMFIVRDNGMIICAAAVNHNVNPEYDDIDWVIKGPREKISSIHALAVSPEYRSQNVSDNFLKEIEDYCRENGDLAIHFDVIDFNTPAYKLYMRNGYTDLGAIEMYYEVVGYKNFYMLEKVL